MPLAALLLMAVGTAAAAPPRIDACALLKPAEIAEVIGQPVAAGQRHDAGLEANGAWSSSCIWPLGEHSFVILNAMQWPAGRAREFLDSFRGAAQEGVLPRPPEARRVGDEALWWGDGLAVRRRDTSFGLSVFHPRTAPAGAGQWEERLASLVLAQVDLLHDR